ncbi:hypothetical protein LTR28_009223, partial [Elasticomyces elasticus]
YILPRTTHPFPSRHRPSPSTTDIAPTPTAPPTLTITLTPMRSSSSTAPPLTLSAQPPETSVHELKAQYAQRTGLSTEKIKLLLHRKPCADIKTLKELLGDVAGGAGGTEVEFAVMVLGGAAVSSTPSTPAVEVPDPAATAAVAPGEAIDIDGPGPLSENAEAQAEAGGSVAGQQGSGSSVLQTEEFWDDLKGFLVQRLRDEREGEKAVAVFRKAWRGS